MSSDGPTPVILELGDAPFDITYRAVVMGILNRTPDSFYDAGEYWDFDDFLRKAERLVVDGADFLDVGGVKAGPGDEVDLDEELRRVVPAIEALVERFDLPISVDTWNPDVLQECLKRGAVIANDISGFEDPRYLEVAAQQEATVVATHIRIGPRIPDPEPQYDDLLSDVRRFLADRVRMALDAGIRPRRIIVDAGMDLGKNRYMSWQLLDRSEELASLGYPLLLSASNKRFLFELLETERHNINEGSMACHAMGIAKGCRILRAHDVKASRRVADTMAEILQRRDEVAVR
ncbi:MAG: dihydropteroate synthase [Acidimicrobiales bacterium]|nr:dihydropteroate synthase [Acidimicrobiales bacterium]